jgi:DNA-binding FadR family transcriptional regulator
MSVPALSTCGKRALAAMVAGPSDIWKPGYHDRVPKVAATAQNGATSAASSSEFATGRPWRPPAGQKSAKLGELVARDIEQRILLLGWPVGEVLGSEPQLIEEYQVSRAVLREAIRLLEHDHIATMRRGPGGGLVVTAPEPDAVIRSVALQLGFQNVTADHLFNTRSCLELDAVKLAASNIDADGIAALERTLEYENTYVDQVDQGVHDLHLVIADISGNPAIRLFLEILTRLTHAAIDHGLVVAPETLVAHNHGTVEELHRAHLAIVEAIISGDEGLAQHRMRRHLEAMHQWVNASGSSSFRR